MALTKIQKQKIIEALKDKFSRQKAVAFADFTGIRAKDLLRLRKKLRELGCELKVAKKTLISLVMKERGVDFDPKQLAGEIVLGFGYKDEISPFKLFYDFSKENDKLKLLGGLMDKQIYDKEKAVELAQMPSKEQLLARLPFILQRSISIININYLRIWQLIQKN